MDCGNFKIHKSSFKRNTFKMQLKMYAAPFVNKVILAFTNAIAAAIMLIHYALI